MSPGLQGGRSSSRTAHRDGWVELCGWQQCLAPTKPPSLTCCVRDPCCQDLPLLIPLCAPALGESC